MTDNFLYDRLHLICFNRIDYEVLSFEVILLCSLFEAAAGFLDTIVENVRKPQQNRWRDISQRQFVHHITQVDLRVVLTWCDIDIALVVDTKVGSAPSRDVVELL